jgi:hypothetical protein
MDAAKRERIRQRIETSKGFVAKAQDDSTPHFQAKMKSEVHENLDTNDISSLVLSLSQELGDTDVSPDLAKLKLDSTRYATLKRQAEEEQRAMTDIPPKRVVVQEKVPHSSPQGLSALTNSKELSDMPDTEQPVSTRVEMTGPSPGEIMEVIHSEEYQDAILPASDFLADNFSAQRLTSGAALNTETMQAWQAEGNQLKQRVEQLQGPAKKAMEERRGAEVMARVGNALDHLTELDGTDADKDGLADGNVELQRPKTFRERLRNAAVRLPGGFKPKPSHLDRMDRTIELHTEDDGKRWLISPVGSYYQGQSQDREIYVADQIGYEVVGGEMRIYEGPELSHELGPQGLNMPPKALNSVERNYPTPPRGGDSAAWNSRRRATDEVLQWGGSEAGMTLLKGRDTSAAPGVLFMTNE